MTDTYSMGELAAQDSYDRAPLRITVRPPSVVQQPGYEDTRMADALYRMGAIAETGDPLIPPPQVPTARAGPAAASTAWEASGIPDAVKAWNAQQTDTEAKDFFFGAAAGALPMKRAVAPAAKVVGGVVKAAGDAAITPMGSIARMATPEEINRMAIQTRKGITQPELRNVYRDLGLTGGDPLPVVEPSLAQSLPADVIEKARQLKLEDTAVLNSLSPEAKKLYREKNKLPKGLILPSQEAAGAGPEFDKLKREVNKAEKMFDRGSKPSLFDLSPETLKQTPDVPQFNLPRVAPEQTERLEPVSRGGLQRLERAAANAPEANWGWYNLMQARDVMHAIHGPERGEQVFQTWLSNVGGTSMVNPIDNNIRSSTWYLGKILRGEALPEVVKVKNPETGKSLQTLAGGPEAGYGAKAQIQHAQRVYQYLTNNYDPVLNPKPISYRMNLGGNWLPRTVDTHDVRNMVGMPYGKSKVFGENSTLLPKEYSYLESVGQRAADRAETAQGPQQAATWIGGGTPSELFPNKGGYTGLKSYPAPLMEVLNRRAHVTGMIYGETAEEALYKAFTGQRPLLSIGGAVGAGGAAAATMGSVAAPDQYEQRM